MGWIEEEVEVTVAIMIGITAVGGKRDGRRSRRRHGSDLIRRMIRRTVRRDGVVV